VKRLLIIAGVFGLVIAVVVIAMGVRAPLRSSERRAWKDNAIDKISSSVSDPAWVKGELAALKKRTGNEDSDGWLSDRLIVMRNGDWLVYANVCRKEDRRLHDLFLGLGSDGRWYYSTYHFCKGMIVLRMEEQSSDLAAFSKTYYLHQFDGHSDDCLQKTWPPASR